jgi:hypothetical protein
MVIDFILQHFQFSDFDFYDGLIFGGHYSLVKQITMPSSFIGKAVCAENDEWNEELGRKIAFSRAKDKCYKSFFKRANIFVQAIDKHLGDMIEKFNDFGLKLENKRETLQNIIDKAIYNDEKE